jgi:hypothetical protein
MKPIKMYYTVWYYREGWGTSYATVIGMWWSHVRAPLAEKYGNDFEW